jgi:hypothetical protein
MANENYDERFDDAPREDVPPNDDEISAKAKAQIRPASTAMIVGGLLLLLFLGLNAYLIYGMDMQVEMMKFMKTNFFANDAKAAAEMDKAIAEAEKRDKTVENITNPISLGLNVVTMAIVTLAGFRMRELKNRGFCMAGSILSLIPCCTCMCIGLPIGIWSLVSLSKKDVKAGFEAVARQSRG